MSATGTDDVTSLVPLWQEQRVKEERARLAKYERELSICQPDGPFAEAMRKMVALQRDVVGVVERHADGFAFGPDLLNSLEALLRTHRWQNCRSGSDKSVAYLRAKQNAIRAIMKAKEGPQ